jgi:uncharacterized protein involved in exopolysaccharide biosynthesis
MRDQNIILEEDEIDLKELFKVLVKNRGFILLFTFIVTLGSVIWVFTRTPIYEASALLEVGHYQLYDSKSNSNSNSNSNSKVALDSASSLAKRLNILFIDMLKGEKDRLAWIDSIKVSKNNKNFIDIKALATSNSLAIKEIENLVSYVQDKHRKILDDIRERRELEIKNIDSKISNIKNKEVTLLQQQIDTQRENLQDFKSQLRLLNKNISKIEKKDPSLTALKLMEKRDLSTYIAELNMKLMELRSQKYTLETTIISDLMQNRRLINSMLLPHNYKNSGIVGETIVKSYPVKPKKSLIVIVSFVTSLILSIFITFLMEFVRDAKKVDS